MDYQIAHSTIRELFRKIVSSHFPDKRIEWEIGKQILQPYFEETARKISAFLQNYKKERGELEKIIEWMQKFFHPQYSTGNLQFVDYGSPSKAEGTKKNPQLAHITYTWANSSAILHPISHFIKNLQYISASYTVNFLLVTNEPRTSGKKADNKYFLLYQQSPAFIVQEATKNIVILFEFRKLTPEEKKRYHGNFQKQITKHVVNTLKNELKILLSDKEAFWNQFEANLEYYVNHHSAYLYIFPSVDQDLNHQLKSFSDGLLLKGVKTNITSIDQIPPTIKLIEDFQELSNIIIKTIAVIERVKTLAFQKHKFVLHHHYILNQEELKITPNHKPKTIRASKSTELTPIINTETLSMKEYKRVFLHIFQNDIDVLGMCMKSENWQALHFLSNRFKEKMDVIYIDPPYNTGNLDFIYKDAFLRSSWMTFLYNRIRLARSLLKDPGIFFSSIDDNELIPLSLIIDRVFPYKLDNIIWHKKTQPSYLSKELITVTEYILAAKTCKSSIPMMGSFGNPKKLTELINIGNKVDKRILPKENVFVRNGWTGTLTQTSYGRGKLVIGLLNGPIQVTDGNPDQDLWLEGRFKWTQERINQEIEKGGQIHIKSTTSLRPTILRHYDSPIIKAPTTLLSKKINDMATNTDANKELKELFGISPFDYSKPTELLKFLIQAPTYQNKQANILDFFAGSGTTGQAVMKLNLEDGGDRKFFLIERESIFENVLIPRLMKNAYSQNWKHGMPQDPQCISGIMEHFHLEQLEDIWLNMANSSCWPVADHSSFPSLNAHDEKYQLQYELRRTPQGYDLQLKNARFVDPFSYWVYSFNNGIITTKMVDLITSFNYFLGLKVSTQKVCMVKETPYFIIEGLDEQKQKVVVFWREIAKIEADQEENIDFKEDFKLDIAPNDIIYSNGMKIRKKANLIAPTMQNLLF